MKKHFLFNEGRIIVFASLIILLFVGCSKESTLETTDNSGVQALSAASDNRNQEYVPNELIVKFKASTSSTKRDEALARVNGEVLERIITKAMQRVGDNEGLTLIRTPLDAVEAAGKIKGAEIEYAEPNYIYTYGAVSDDTYYTNGSLWGMYGDATTPANQYGSQSGEAWANNHTGSKSVHVGVIDEGIQFTHPELDAIIWNNQLDPAPGDGIDNDGNGYVDDIHGWDFDRNDNTIYDGGTRGSLDDHGTHVSGTIGGEGGNGAGVTGVNWAVTIISAKFLGRRGGTTANAVKAVDYLTDLKTRHDLDLVASNNSWGGGGFSQALYDAIERANTGNILFIAAAGNGGSDGVGDDNDKTNNYPSNYDLDNVIAVAAITSSGAKSSFSNYGATKVDLGAPGSGIYSTTAFNTYSSYSGTSMATPHVTGAAALYKSTHGTATASQIKSAILSTTTPTALLAGKCVSGGRLNVSSF